VTLTPEEIKQLRRDYYYRRNRKAFLRSARACGICGEEFPRGVKYPHPLSKTLDHVLPAVAMTNPRQFFDMRLWRAAHLECNTRTGASGSLFVSKRSREW
jgi:hypothetical protein